MKIRTVTALFAVGALAISGCSSDDSSSNGDDTKETTTTTAADTGDRDLDALVAALQEDSEFDDEQATCIANEAIAGLSDDGYELTLDNADFEDYSDDDITVISGSLDECIDIEVIKELMLSEGLGDMLDDEAAECIAESMVSSFDGIGSMFVELNDPDSEDRILELTSEAYSSCLDDDQSIEFVSQLLQGQGLAEADVACVLGEIEGAYTGSEVLSALLAQDADLIAEMDAAGELCLAGAGADTGADAGAGTTEG